ncbi:MAG: hypothetical protein IJR45_04205 [Firmicutes bacterium]|nr:hypothetical protein [Clostridia bacterium]MBQ9604600.1 hypothetical protein [Bacillota bacterium]
MELTQVELNNIREIVSGCISTADKMRAYAASCSDKQLKQMFSDSAAKSQQDAEKLIQML